MNARLPKLRVAFVLTPRFTLTAFAGFVDTLRLAADEDDRSRPIDCVWNVLGKPGEPITSSCGVTLQASEPMHAPERFDYIVIVGGLMHGGQKIPEGLDAFLSKAVAAEVPLVGLCTGSFVLARLGYLDGHTACVSWFHREEFAHEFPRLNATSNCLYTIDRDRLTCAGGTSVVHLAAKLVARHQGKSLAEKSLRIMLEDHPLPGNTPQPEQVITHTAHDPLVKRAMLFIEEHLSDSNDLSVLPELSGISPRQLQRRFVADIGISAMDYRARLRLSRARWLIQHTRISLTEISFELGFADGAHLSRSFRRYFGTSPSQIRRLSAHH